MPNQAVQEQIEQSDLILAVDATRSAHDPHKLPTFLRRIHETRLAEKPAAAVYDAATQKRRVPAMPAHTSFLRPYRKPCGGVPEAAGVSNTTTVSVVQFSPLTPAVTYEFWLVGVNSQGEGPQSNHVTHTVPVGP